MRLLLALVFVAGNAFFVAVEFALVASRQTKLEQIADPNSVRGRAALHAVGRLPRYIAGVQLGVTMMSLLLGAVAEPAISDLLVPRLEHRLSTGVAEATSFVIALSIVVFMHTVFGELAPKSASISAPERSLLWLALPMRGFIAVFGPVVTVLSGAAAFGLRLLGVRTLDALVSAHTADEIGRMIEQSHEEGLLRESEHQRLAGVIGIVSAPVSSVMTPRDRIVAVPRTATVAQAEQVLVQYGHSRLPVYGRGFDDVLGFVHAKDLLEVAPGARERPIPWRAIRRMLVVSQTRPLDQVLRSMRRARLHLALVVDEDGRTAGVVTLEDVLEEVVGEIADETDRN
ncbi:MAG: hemolysin family protein [Acidimicrobiia bacterium]